MLNDTKIENIAVQSGKQSVLALIEAQTILQLLVKKGIVTPEDVNITRNIVRSQPKYLKEMQSLDNAIDNINESMKFEDIFAKKLKGEELTTEEDNYLRNVAKQML